MITQLQVINLKPGDTLQVRDPKTYAYLGRARVVYVEHDGIDDLPAFSRVVLRFDCGRKDIELAGPALRFWCSP